MYVERLAERLNLTPATISFHLKKLEEAGAVKKGTNCVGENWQNTCVLQGEEL